MISLRHRHKSGKSSTGSSPAPSHRSPPPPLIYPPDQSATTRYHPICSNIFQHIQLLHDLNSEQGTSCDRPPLRFPLLPLATMAATSRWANHTLIAQRQGEIFYICPIALSPRIIKRKAIILSVWIFNRVLLCAPLIDCKSFVPNLSKSIELKSKSN